jgi:SnoaL-like polyketide cyclase
LPPRMPLLERIGMSSEENAEVTRRWYTEGWTGHFDIAEEIFAPDLAVNGQVVGPAGPQHNCANRHIGFPDVHVIVEEQVVTGDRVVTRALVRDAHWPVQRRGADRQARRGAQHLHLALR